ncbi:hypothetical protein J1614_009979 [Plenodomus biglobosus]|nr:hypothetical protein J1614_009979 [Plenodomus biglobosus]
MTMPETAAAPASGHRRNKSAAVFKSIISSKGHRRAPSDGTALTKSPLADAPYLVASNLQTPLLPPDHPDSQLRPTARSENIPNNPPSPQKWQDSSRSASPKKSLHKKTLSSVSLRSLAKKQDKSKEKESSEARRARKEEEAAKKPKKTKSTTNLATMFGKGKAKDRQQSPAKEGKDKENTTPPTSTTTYRPPQTPIWAEFSSRDQATTTTTSKVPLNDQRRSIEDEIALYTPQEYSPAKQRDFSEYGQPSLQKRPAAKERPKSMVVPKTTSTISLLETFSRKKTSDRVPLSDTKGNEGRQRDSSPTKNPPSRPVFARSSTDNSGSDIQLKPMAPPPATTKKPNRVMAAVAAFNGKAKQTETAPASPTKLDPKVVDAEFEAVLVSEFHVWPGAAINNIIGIAKHPNSPTWPDANVEA